MTNQAPDYITKIGSTDRIRLSCTASIVKHGNPYGDYANELLKALNVAWKARRVIAIALTLDPALTTQVEKELQEINAQYRELIAFLEQHKVARPYQFDQYTGYSYVNFGPKWEGRWSNK